MPTYSETLQFVGDPHLIIFHYDLKYIFLLKRDFLNITYSEAKQKHSNYYNKNFTNSQVDIVLLQRQNHCTCNSKNIHFPLPVLCTFPLPLDLSFLSSFSLSFIYWHNVSWIYIMIKGLIFHQIKSSTIINWEDHSSAEIHARTLRSDQMKIYSFHPIDHYNFVVYHS